MAVSDPIYLVIIALALVTSLYATVYSWQRKSVEGARTFALNSALGVAFTLCVLLLVLSPNREVALISLRLRAILNLLSITTFPLFILDFAGYKSWLSPRRIWIFVIFPLFTIIVALTNPFGNWLVIGYTVQRQDFLLYEHYQNGPLITISLMYAFLLYIGLMIILANQSLHVQPPFRWQVLILLVIVAFTGFITIPSLSNLSGGNQFTVSPVMLQTIFRSVLITWALFSFRFLNIMPIASNAIIEGTHFGVIVLDSQQRVVTMNRAALTLAATNLTAAVGQTVQEILPVLSDLFARYDGNKEIIEQVRIGLHDSPRLFECQLYPLEPKGTRRVGHLLWLTDITRRKEAESEIRKLSLAVEQSPTSIVITDNTGHIEYVNQHFINLTGYTFEEAIGQDPRLLKSGRTPPDTYRDLWDTILSGQVWTGQFLNKKKNSEVYWEQANIAPVIDENKQITHFVAVKEDITQRKQAEAEREQLIADLDAYAHTVAHDLKNPVGILIGYSDLILDPEGQLPDSERLQYIEMIKKTSFKMQSIIDELLLLSSIRTQTNIPVKPLDMQKMVKEVLERLEPFLKANGAKVTIRGDWPIANGYAGWLEEVWVNYLSNAVKYGGTPPEIEIGAEPQGEQVRFWVRDNGQGIDPDQHSHLFQEFSRVSESSIKGHGLGLSIVRRIVEKLDGKVGVESAIGRGSTFFFLLPGVSANGHGTNINV